MRPSRLRMQAFGPFAGEEMIDFGALDGSALFLIHGPTGAGKTTILDAICYALYGETSGDERSGAQMRSEFAPVELSTEVVFDFRFQGRVYRVKRSPQQLRPKKRGDGFTPAAPDAELWDRTDVTEPDADGEHLASQPTKVTDRIKAMLGFSSAQFRQVVMLPQGQFRRVLTAPTAEREQIFEQLFGTDLYRVVSENLKARSKALNDDLRERQSKATHMLQQRGVASVDEFAALEIAAAETLRVSEESAEQAKRDRDAKQQAHDVAKEAQRKLDEVGTAQQALLAQEARRGETQQQRVRLASARKAEPLAHGMRALEQRATDATRARDEHAAAQKDATAKAETLRQASAVLASEHARDPERAEMARRLVELSALEGKASVLVAATDKREAAMHARAEADRAVKKAEAEHAKHSLARTETTTELEKLRVSAATRAELRLKIDHARARRGAEEECERLEAKLLQATRRAEETTGAEQTAQTIHRELQLQLEGLEQRWRAGQAAVLARGLTEGEPCPVCGSPDHPAVAVAAQDVPEATELDGLKARVGEAQHSVVERASAKAAARKEMEGTGEALRAAQDELAKRSVEGVDPAEVTALEAQLQQAIDAAKRVPDKEKALAQAQASVERSDLSRRACASALSDADKTMAVAQESFASAQATLPEGLRTADDLERAQTDAATRDAALKRALADAEDAERTAGQQAAKAEYAREAAKAQLDRATEALEQAQEASGTERRAAGFDDEAVFEAAMADVPQIEALAQAVQAFDVAVDAAADRVERAKLAAQGVSAPDLASVLSALEQAQQAHDRALGVQAAAKLQREQLRDALSAVRAELKGVAGREAQQRRLAHLSEVANGKNERNLSFQRFVLAVLLDDVLLAATERLHRMSRGRYQLVRSDEVGHRAQAAGLELFVNDSYSGTRRPVATLSGGESFLAALSLSLGLVDVVQAYAGGAELDALFIDEGFGSLDDESLERAIDVLAELNGGGRLIGIISHVKELRQRIDARLEVRRTQSGSTTTLSVG